MTDQTYTPSAELPEPDAVVDAAGRRCPVPVIELARHLTDVEIGGVIAVLADDVAARHDVPAWCAMRGHDYLGERAASQRAGEDPVVAYLVRRRG